MKARLLGVLISLVLPASVALAYAPAELEESGNPEVLSKYLSATQTQQEALKGARMEVDIDAKLPRLSKQGKLRALRQISRLGQIIYRPLGFSGDDTVKKEVIARFLTAESEARDAGTIAITPANYKFKYKQTTNAGVAVFQITPKRKAVGLFKGELWLDVVTGMPLREAGQFVKNPSLFLKKIAFVRQYEMHDGVSIPKHLDSTVDTRLVGRAELSIEFLNFSKQDDDAPAAPDVTPRDEQDSPRDIGVIAAHKVRLDR